MLQNMPVSDAAICLRILDCGVDPASLASCLSDAFSSGLWSDTPMPVGHVSDPDSAWGILSGLGEKPISVAAIGTDGVLGCVLGVILTPELITLYGLGPWNAKPGDGLLAFIGIATDCQGKRVSQDTDGRFVLNSDLDNPSFARCLFKRWLTSSKLKDCPRVFIRTRRRIGAVRHLARGFGFSECGRFQVLFRGHRQFRLVYRRTHKGVPVLWNAP